MAAATCIATTLEKRRPLPVDAIIPDPIFTSTHAITIDAPPEQVWPWIAQMGSGRAGWYSWDAIDNGGTPSVTTIMPAFQTVVPGDIMPAIPGAKDAFVVGTVDPPRELLLTVPDGHGGNAVGWEHVLDPLPDGRTRLLVRGRASSHWVDLARAKPPAGISMFLLWVVVLATVLLRTQEVRRRPIARRSEYGHHRKPQEGCHACHTCPDSRGRGVVLVPGPTLVRPMGCDS